MAIVGCARTVPAPRHSEAMERSARILRAARPARGGPPPGQRRDGDLRGAGRAALARAEQMACKVTDEHVTEIHRLAMAQEEKMLGKRIARLKKRKTMAMARRQPSRHAVAAN